MSLHPRISVSSVCSFSWTLEEDLRFWSGAGISAVGLSANKMRAAGLGRAVRLVADSGLEVTNLICPDTFDLASPEGWPAAQDGLCALVDASGEVGAGCLVLTTGGGRRLSWEEAADALGEAISPVLAHARGAGVKLALEHTNSLRSDIGFLHTLADALDLARELGVGVCMETNACWQERELAATIASGADLLRLVQVSDFVLGTRSTPDRAVPGDGDIPLERILGELLAAGYQGAFDLEMIGPRIEQEGYPSAILRAAGALGATLDSLGA